ncbi:uncharacterized protein LOC107030062 [Solanum pennellii]|uniref:Uncharacterized protein LOC107030062 n=1 Tax=Solanum pennellii TaxID=28526 RepID=A0ABM1HKW2_SOLPN|nr:uncharacterized protein LOC107030062 [Solanum pennellii]
MVVEYVSKWVEAIPLPENDGKSVVGFEEKCLLKGATPYHLQTSDQVEVSNRKISISWQKAVNANRTNWERKLDDTQWAYQTTFKMSIGMSTYQLVFGKTCYLPTDLEHKALLALMKLNLSWTETANLRLDKVNKMDEFLLRAYERSPLYKERIKLYHDNHIMKRTFILDD